MPTATLATEFTQDPDDITIGTVADTTADYGSGSNQDRGDAANFLLWSKTDEDAVRTFDNPAFGNELAIMEWQVNTPKDGWYEGILLRIQPYDAGANYVEEQSSGSVITQHASIFYYAATDKVYKAIAASTGQTPTNTSYFTEVTDLSTILDNTNIEVVILNVYVRTRAAACANDLHGKLDDRNCPNPDVKTKDKAYLIDALITSADANVAAGNYDQMDRIMRQIESKCQLAA